jgi:hypothetical protein
MLWVQVATLEKHGNGVHHDLGTRTSSVKLQHVVLQMHIKAKAKRLKVRESEVKLPAAVSLAFADVRERDWANVVTAHTGDSTAYTWMLSKYRQDHCCLFLTLCQQDQCTVLQSTGVPCTCSC